MDFGAILASKYGRSFPIDGVRSVAVIDFKSELSSNREDQHGEYAGLVRDFAASDTTRGIALGALARLGATRRTVGVRSLTLDENLQGGRRMR